MKLPKLALLSLCALAAGTPALGANVVASKGNAWPTRTVDVLICDAAALDRLGERICAPQKPKKGGAKRSARLDAEAARLVRQTLRRWNASYGQNIRVREVTRPAAQSTLVFRASSRDTRCSTQKVGFIPSQRLKYVSIGSQCNKRVAPKGTNQGTVAHEILHAIGLYHEQQRQDLAELAKVKRSGRKAHQWKATCDPSDDHCKRGQPQAKPVGAYDFASIMHYSLEGKPVKLTKAGRARLSAQGLRKSEVGQRNWLSKADARAIRKLYPERGPAPPSGRRVYGAGSGGRPSVTSFPPV